MTWEYSGDPTTSAKDEVRFLLGDTDADNQLLSDEEIAFLVLQYPDQTGLYANYRAAASGAYILSARYTKSMRKSVGSLSIDYGQLVTQFRDLGDSLMALANSPSGRKIGGPQLGGGGEKYLMGNDYP